MAKRPPGWHFCRALLLAYSGAVLAFALLMLPVLLLVHSALGRLGRKRRDPFWPVTRWMLFISTLPRMATWIENRL